MPEREKETVHRAPTARSLQTGKIDSATILALKSLIGKQCKQSGAIKLVCHMDENVYEEKKHRGRFFFKLVLKLLTRVCFLLLFLENLE